MHLEHPDTLITILHLITLLAIPIHVFGTYCILFKTPKSMESVKLIMLNFHVWCMVLDYGITVLTVPYLLFPVLGGFPLGILKDIGVPIEVQSYGILTLVAVVSAAAIDIIENRYYIVFAQNTKWRRYRIILTIFNYSCSLAWTLPAFILLPDQNTAAPGALRILEKFGTVPEYIRKAPIFVISFDLRTITLPCMIIAGFFVVEVVVFVVVMTRGMSKLKQTARFSKSTLKMQRNFLNAIYIQVSVYITSIQLPIFWFIVSILADVHFQAINNLGFVMFSFNGVVSTVIMIWIHRPYRDFCLKIVKLNKLSNNAVHVDSGGTIHSVAPRVTSNAY